MPKAVKKQPAPKQEIVLLRNSERGVFKECRQRWWWSYVDFLVRKGSDQRALRFGTLVHLAFASYYIPGVKRGVHPAKTFVREYRKELKAGLPELTMLQETKDRGPVDAEELGTDMLNHYVQHYGPEPDIEILSPEMACQVDVHDPQTGEYLFTYVFRVDAVYRSRRTGRIGMLEHKTSASAAKPGTPVELDEQGRSYWAFGEPHLRHIGVLTVDDPVDILLYNILRKGMRDPRPQNEQGQHLNQDGSVSKSQPPPYFHRFPLNVSEYERGVQISRAISEFKEMRMVKAGELEVIKNPGQHCRGCPFFDMCQLHETGDDWESLKEELYVVGDPYSDHRDALEEV